MQGAGLGALCLDMSQSHDSHVMSLKQAYDKAGKKCNILFSKTQGKQFDDMVVKESLPSLSLASNPGLEAYGPSSMCLTLSKPWTTVNSRGAMATQADWGAGCYQVGMGRRVQVGVGRRVTIDCHI